MLSKSTPYDFPFDVWSEIASFTPTCDLARLSATSSTLQSILRPLLYRVVIFDDCDWRPTLDLLARDKALASAVVQLGWMESCTIYLFNPVQRSMNLVAIGNLTNLRHFQIGGSIFFDDAEQSEFWQILASSPLEWLAYKPWDPQPRLPCHSDECGGLGGLKVIQWQPHSTEDLTSLWAVLSRSLETLSSLTLPSFALDQSHRLRLLNMHFPNLRSFTVHPLVGHTSAVSENCLTEFLTPHDTLEELCLHASLAFNVSQLTANSFPRLRYFRGSSSSFEAVLLAGMTSLSKTLRRLAIHFSSPDSHHCNQIFAFLQSLNVRTSPVTPAFPMLREIEILDHTLPLSFIQEFIRHCERSFGSTLEVFAAHVCSEELVAGHITQLAPLFQPFKKLKIVDITVVGHPVYSCLVIVRRGRTANRRAIILSMSLLLVRELFTHCATLEEVRLNLTPLDWEHTWIVMRNPDSSGERCPSDDCTGHLIHVPYMTSPSSHTSATASVGTAEGIPGT